jgi:hypothetical protein
MRAIARYLCHGSGDEGPKWVTNAKTEDAEVYKLSTISTVPVGVPIAPWIDVGLERRIVAGYASMISTRVFDSGFRTRFQLSLLSEEDRSQQPQSASADMLTAPCWDAWDIAVGACLLARYILGPCCRLDTLAKRRVAFACLSIACKVARGEAFYGLRASPYRNVIEATCYNVVFPVSDHIDTMEANAEWLSDQLYEAEADILVRHSAALFPLLFRSPATRVEAIAHAAMDNALELTANQARSLSALRNVASHAVQTLLQQAKGPVVEQFESSATAHDASVALFVYSTVSVDLCSRARLCEFRLPQAVLLASYKALAACRERALGIAKAMDGVPSGPGAASDCFCGFAVGDACARDVARVLEHGVDKLDKF